MLLQTQTVTINAAFLREIKEDHEELRELLAKTQAIARARFRTRRRARRFAALLAALLAELRDRLAMHFSLEEAYGYFDEPLSVTPHLSERAERLRRQHADLYLEMNALAERGSEVATSKRPGQGMRMLGKEFMDFRRRFAMHESLENELILDAFLVDVGVGD